MSGRGTRLCAAIALDIDKSCGCSFINNLHIRDNLSSCQILKPYIIGRKAACGSHIYFSYFGLSGKSETDTVRFACSIGQFNL